MVLPTINGELNFLRKLITIDGSKVTTETSIPLGLNVNLPGVSADGSDVRLAKLDGTPIAREIECVNVPNTDDVMIWYPFDTVSGTDSQFWVYWGNSNLTEPAEDATYGREAVWSTDHDAVYHMASLTDSTSNDRDGTIVGTVTLEDGTYGKQYDFQGSSDWIQAPTGITSYPFTLSIVMKSSSVASYRYFLYLGDASSASISSGIGTKYLNPTTYEIEARSVEGDFLAWSSAGLATTNRAILDVVFRSATDREMYLDSNSIITDVDSIAFNAAIDVLLIGQLRLTSPEISTLIGTAEEVRVRSDEKTENEITTTYNNLKNPTAAGTSPFYLSFGLSQHQRRVSQFIN